MDIALIGYGKMGKAIEEIAIERGHRITLKFSSDNLNALTESNLQTCDIAIEFTRPEAAVDNMITCLKAGIPVVCGTTGWYRELDAVVNKCNELNGSLLYASNFSVGVNIFFELNQHLAKIMNTYNQYDVRIEEVHHTEKKDKPSGTAITLANQIIGQLDRKTGWKLDGNSATEQDVVIKAIREEDVKGTHTIFYQSEIDDIEISHKAHSRKGFALGAVLAAEYIKNKKGIFSMKDVLNIGR